MARVAIFGFDGFRVGEYVSPEYVERTLGANTGNLLFWSATKSLFSAEYEYLSRVGKVFPSYEYVNRTCTVLIKPAANHLDPKILNPQMVEYLSHLNIPILILGLGAQLGSVDEIPSAKEKLESFPHCVKFIDVLNDKCPVVCARGHTSAQLLSELGYRGVIEVTGCPSQTLSVDTELGSTIAANLSRLVEKLLADEPLSIQHLLPSQWDKHLAWTVDKVHELFAADRLLDVQQSGGVENFNRYFDRSGLNFDAQVSDSNHSDPIMFFNLESWAAAIRDVDFSVGTRIHGNILASQLGIPCLVLSHDVRVNELSEQMALPWIDFDKFKTIASRSGLREYIRFDVGEFDRRRAENLSKFRKALETVGLTPSEKLTKLTAGREQEVGVSS